MKNILYIQHAGIINDHAEQVITTLERALGPVKIDFASEPTDIRERSFYDAVITPTVDWLPEALERIASSPVLHFQSAGVEKIWEMKFDKSRYLMTKSTGVHAIPMSEFAIGAMLFFAKSFDQFISQSQQRVWRRKWLNELNGKHLVILGLGSVGSMISSHAIAFGMTVSGTRESGLPMDGIQQVTSLDSVESLVATADYIVVSLPLTSETHGVVGEKLLKRCKKGAVLIDISRGGVVDSNAVSDALNEGHLRGVALDVFENEPLEKDSILWAQNNILLTPHVSGTTPHYLDRVLESFINVIKTIDGGLAPKSMVDVERGY